MYGVFLGIIIMVYFGELSLHYNIINSFCRVISIWLFALPDLTKWIYEAKMIHKKENDKNTKRKKRNNIFNQKNFTALYCYNLKTLLLYAICKKKVLWV